MELNSIIYSINEEEMTAGIIGLNTDINELIIPLLINSESKDYIITSILEGAFSHSKIDSKLHTIEKESFSNSSLERIEIPSQVITIGERAFYNCRRLYQIEIPTNSNLQTKETKHFHAH